MTRFTLPAAALAVALSSVASAQPQPPGGPPQMPAFSPYLNLLNRSGSPAMNYYGLVLPQQQLMQQQGQLQQQLGNANLENQNLQLQNQQIANTIISAFLPATGNVATFNNTRGYFNRIGGGAGFNSFGGGRPGGATGMQPSFARPAGGGSGLNRSGGVGGAPGGGGAPGFTR